MAVKKIQIIPPENSYADVLHPETDDTMVLITDANGYFTGTKLDAVLDEIVDVKTATISTTWIGTEAPYTQEVSVTGITANHNPIISPVYSATNATAILEKTAWNLIGKAVTGAGIITFTCFEEKPVTAIPIQIKGV